MMLLENAPPLSEDSPAPAAPVSAEELFRRHVPQLYSLARRMMGNDVDAEDVVGDVLVAVLRKLDGFRGEAKLSTWLHRVTVNAALAHRRKRARRECQLDLPPVAFGDEAALWGAGASPEGPEERALNDEMQQKVEGAIAGLAERYRDVFVLADVEHLSNADIGALLGLSLSAVKSRLHTARLLLRQALAPYFCWSDQADSGSRRRGRRQRVRRAP